MSDKPQHKNRHPQKKAPVLTPEEQAKVLAARAKALEEEKAERQRIELYGKSVEKMSHRQLRGELTRLIKREYAGKPPEPQAGLNICLGTVFLAVLDNTKTVRDKYTRPDQINPSGKLMWAPR
jgi:hypothetical protein